MVVKTQLSFICYAVIHISNYNYMFLTYLVAIIRLYIFLVLRILYKNIYQLVYTFLYKNLKTKNIQPDDGH